MKLLFIFLDGVGLGRADPEFNPFVSAPMPNLEAVLGGSKLVADGRLAPQEVVRELVHSQRASLLALDACLGVEGMPQSATGQAALLTGKNAPAMLGFHDGPKPSPAVIEILRQGTLFSRATENENKVSLLNAYPPRYFQSIDTGYRLPGVIALSARFAGMHLKTMEDLFKGEAISADFTAHGWHSHLGFEDTPVLNPDQAGERLNELADSSNLSIFEYWLTDVAGHHQDMPAACAMLELFDHVMGSLMNTWDGEQGLILMTSDHGNLEDLSTRHHTRNPVPLLLIGSLTLREEFIAKLNQGLPGEKEPDLTSITPAILDFIR